MHKLSRVFLWMAYVMGVVTVWVNLDEPYAWINAVGVYAVALVMIATRNDGRV